MELLTVDIFHPLGHRHLPVPEAPLLHTAGEIHKGHVLHFIPYCVDGDGHSHEYFVILIVLPGHILLFMNGLNGV